MNVTSVAGSTSGSTTITVDPTLTSGNSYKYKISVNPRMPAWGQECTTGYKVWDGESEIISDSEFKIVVAEVDANNRCVGAGIAEIVSRA